MLDTPQLYHSDPRVRWATASALRAAAALDVAREIEKRFAQWPKYWWGVVNPWLVFVGPSPGNSQGRPVDWARERMPTLGEVQVHFREYVDSTGFWNRMRAWTTAAYSEAGIFSGDPNAAMGSVLLANLVPEKQGDAGKIPTDDLERATPKAVSLLSKLRPRVIVPMEKRISPLLLREFERHGAKVVSGPTTVPVEAKNQKYTHYRPSVWELSTAFGSITIAESPQHPSKSNFYDPRLVDAYLSSIMRGVLDAAG